MNLSLGFNLSALTVLMAGTTPPSGDLETMPVDFKGYQHVNATSFTIAGIVMADTVNVAPRIVQLSVGGMVSGTAGRTLSSNAVNYYQDADYTWTITHADGSPIADNEGVTLPNTVTAFNPYTDQRKPNCSVPIREAGSYKATVTGRMKVGGTLGTQVLVATQELLFTVAENSQSVQWVDGTNGLDSNDGLDPWGLSLTTASYDNSTRTLTQVGGFTDYDHTAAVADARTTYQFNKIYLSGSTEGLTAGLYEIESKTSNDAVVLKTALGANHTSVTSSNGAKQTVEPQDGYVNMYRGGNTYTIATNTNLSLESKCIYGYDGKPTFRGGGSGNVLFRTYMNSSGTVPADHRGYVGNLIIDGEHVNHIFGEAWGASNGGLLTHLLDDVQGINNASGFMITLTGLNAPREHHLVWNCKLNNTYRYREEYTVATATLGASVIAVNEDIGGNAPASGRLNLIDIYGRLREYPYSSHDGVGKQFTLDAVTVTDDFEAGNRLVTSGLHEDFGHAISETLKGSNGVGNASVMFCILDADSRDDIREHGIYPTGYMDYYDCSYNYFRTSVGAAQCINFTMSTAVLDHVSHYATLCGNYMSEQFRHAMTVSKTNYAVPQEYFEDLYIADNDSNTRHAFLYCEGDLLDVRVCHNSHQGVEHTGGTFRAEEQFIKTGSVDRGVYDNNDINELPLANDGGGSGSSEEYVDNTIQHTATVQGVELTSATFGANAVVTGNNFWIPNLARIGKVNGVYMDLSTFNTHVGGANTANNPAANTAPVMGVLAFPEATVGISYSYQVPTTGGTPTSYTLETGTMSNGLSFNTTTGIISGTPTTDADLTGISVSATNAYGTSLTSNTDTLVVNAATAPRISFVSTNGSYIIGDSTYLFSIQPLLNTAFSFKFKKASNSKLFADSVNSSRFLAIENDDEFVIRNSTVYRFTTGVTLTDNAEHTVVITTNSVTGELTVTIDGIDYSEDTAQTTTSPLYLNTCNTQAGDVSTTYDQSIWDVVNADDGVTKSYPFDAGYLNGLNGDTQDNEEGTGALIRYVNTVAAEWSDNP